jgi:hypothetical protein
LTLLQGVTKRLHFHEERKAGNAVTPSSDKDTVAKPKKPVLFDGPRGIWTVDIVGVGTGNANVTVKRTDGVGADVAVTVNAPLSDLALPAENTDAGLLARVLLAEVRSPAKKSYDATAAKTSMQWMRIVIENRLKDPGRFGAKGATDIKQIIRAKGQFRGFEDYPKLAAGVKATIKDILKTANEDGHPLQDKYRQHVQDAIDVASATSALQDPSPNGLIGWRTEDSGDPGGDFIDYDIPKMGNQFYQWKK